MIHAHEILKLIGCNERTFTKNSLQISVNELYGDNAKFTNCSGAAHDFNEIFNFFIEKSKIIIDENGEILLQTQNICS